MGTDLIGDVTLVILSIMAGAIVWLAVILTRLHRALLGPTVEQRLGRLSAQTEMNLKMLETKDGREALARFALSEAGILSFLDDLGERVAGKEASTLEEVVSSTDVVARAGWWPRAKDWLSKNKGMLGETLLGKINDLVKTALGGG